MCHAKQSGQDLEEMFVRKAGNASAVFELLLLRDMHLMVRVSPPQNTKKNVLILDTRTHFLVSNSV